jgi:glutathione S-transferase
MAIKLHTCSATWLKINAHPCWVVRKALDDAGVEYELDKGSMFNRAAVKELSGQPKYPVIEFEDGRIYREESKDMAARIAADKLFDAPASDAPAS